MSSTVNFELAAARLAAELGHMVSEYHRSWARELLRDIAANDNQPVRAAA